MDRTAASMVAFASALTCEDLSPKTVRSVKDHVIDSIAVAPATQCCRLIAECHDGRTETLERRLEPEEVLRSVTSEDVKQKFRQLVWRHMGSDDAGRLLELLENLKNIERMSAVVDQIRLRSAENS